MKGAVGALAASADLHGLSSEYGTRLRAYIDEYCAFGPTYSPDEAEYRILSILRAMRSDGTAPRWLDVDVDAISDLPLIDRATVRERLLDFISIRHPISDWWVRRTSGTTGPPLPVLYSTDFMMEFLHLAVFKILCLRGLGIPHNSGVFCVAIGDNPAYPESLINDPSGLVGPTLQVNIKPQDPDTWSRVLSLLNSVQPNVITSKPSIYELLIRMLHLNPNAFHFAPTALISSGAELTSRLREALAIALRTTVINAYGMTEFGLVASDCPQGRLHLHSSDIYVEVYPTELDPYGPPEIVLSSARNDVLPLLRYRTGDRGRVSFETCPCGLRTPQILEFDGRRAECFRFPNGLVTPTAFNALFDSFAIAEFQLEQVSRSSVVFRFQPLRPDTWGRESDAKLEMAIRENVPVNVELRIEQKTFEYAEKFQRFRAFADD